MWFLLLSLGTGLSGFIHAGAWICVHSLVLAEQHPVVWIYACLPIDQGWTSGLFPSFGSYDSSCKEYLWASVGLSTSPQYLGWIFLEEESLVMQKLCV